MADKGILFSQAMARATWCDRKTNTRRIVNTLRGFGRISEFGHSTTVGFDWHFRDSEMRWHDISHSQLMSALPYQVGDRLWVREPWRTFPSLDDMSPAQFPIPDRSTVSYLASREGHVADGRYRQGRFMPRWASRMTLFVTGVKVEFLHAITNEDVLAEGIYQVKLGDIRDQLECPETLANDPDDLLFYAAPGDDTEDCMKTFPVSAFEVLWDSINGQRDGCTWEDNPWVAAYSFKVHCTNIDQLGAAGAEIER